jgi:hypothetical protein
MFSCPLYCRGVFARDDTIRKTHKAHPTHEASVELVSVLIGLFLPMPMSVYKKALLEEESSNKGFSSQQCRFELVRRDAKP